MSPAEKVKISAAIASASEIEIEDSVIPPTNTRRQCWITSIIRVWRITRGYAMAQTYYRIHSTFIRKIDLTY